MEWTNYVYTYHKYIYKYIYYIYMYFFFWLLDAVTACLQKHAAASVQATVPTVRLFFTCIQNPSCSVRSHPES